MKKKTADLLGIGSAVLCIIHCLLVPVLIIYGVTTQHLILGWEYLDWIFIAVSGIAVFIANKHEQKDKFSLLMWVAWAMFAMALSLHEQHASFLYISVALSVVLALMHLLHLQKKHFHIRK